VAIFYIKSRHKHIVLRKHLRKQNKNCYMAFYSAWKFPICFQCGSE